MQGTLRAKLPPLRGPAVVVGALAAAWCVATLAFVVVHSAVDGLTFAGPYAAYFPADQLRYLAWIRDAGLHGLIADPFRAGAVHVYLHPMFFISGLLWRAGLSIQAAYLVWTPLALVTLVWGYSRFASEFLAGGERVAATALALLFLSPLAPALDYSGILNANGAFYLVIVAGHGVPYWQAWGFLPTLIALGLMPVFLLGVKVLLSGVGDRRLVIATAVAGLLVSWLHPWGGIELVVIVLALLVLRRTLGGSGGVVLAGLVTALPLIYYAIIAGSDPAWSLSQLRSGSGVPPEWWPLVAAFGPLLLVALPARRWPRSVSEQIVVVWPVAALLVYVVLGSTSRVTALEGMSLPLSILAVRGWRQLRCSRLVSFVALFIAVVPGAFYSAHTFRDTFRDRYVPFALTSGEQRAVDVLRHLNGPVLATGYLAPALPALAGRLSIAAPPKIGLEEFFDGGPVSAQVRELIEARRISVVISDCNRRRAELSGVLRPLGFKAQSFGCARMYLRAALNRGT